MANQPVETQFTGDATALFSVIESIQARFRSLKKDALAGSAGGGTKELQFVTDLVNAHAKIEDRLKAQKAEYEKIAAISRQLKDLDEGRLKAIQQVGVGSPLGAPAFFGAGKGDSKDFRAEQQAREDQAQGSLEQLSAEAKLLQITTLKNNIQREGSVARREQLAVLNREQTAQERINFLLSDARVGDAIRAREAALRGSSKELERQAQLLREQALGQVGTKEQGQLRSTLGVGDKRREAALKREAQATQEIFILTERVAQSIQGGAAKVKELAAGLDRAAAAAGETATFTQGLRLNKANVADADKLANAYHRQALAAREVADATKFTEAAKARLAGLQRDLGTDEAVKDIEQQQKEAARLQQELFTDEGATKAAGGLVELQAAYARYRAQLLLLTKDSRKYLAVQKQMRQTEEALAAEVGGGAAGRGVPTGRPAAGLEADLKKQIPLLNKVVSGAFNDFQRRFVATLQFAVSGALIFGVQRMAREFLTTAIEVERAFVDIASAFEFDTAAARGTSAFNEQLETLRQQILRVSNEFNVLPTVANEAAFALVSRFKDPENALIALRAQLLATKVATIDQDEALRSLTAVSEAFAAQTESTNDALTLQERILRRETAAAQLQVEVLDQAVIIQQQWGVTVEDTVEGTARAAQVLGQLGFTAQETQALVAALSLTLGQTGQASAERLNRSIGQITSEGVQEELLGIARASDAFKLSVSDFDSGSKAFYAILDQIDRLQDVDPEAVTKIFEAIGQRRELEAVAAVFQSGDLQADMMRSFGDAADAAEKRFAFLDATISERIASIGARFEELAGNLSKLGALTPIKLMVSLLDKALIVINGIVRAFIDLQEMLNRIATIPILGGLGSASLAILSVVYSLKQTLHLISLINKQQKTGLVLDRARAVAQWVSAGLTGRAGAAGVAGASGMAATTTGSGLIVMQKNATKALSKGAITASHRLLAFAGAAGIGALAIAGIVGAFNRAQDAVDEWTKQARKDAAALETLREEGPAEGETELEALVRYLISEQTQTSDRGPEPAGPGGFFFGGIDNALDFEAEALRIDFDLTQAIINALKDELSTLPDDLKGEDLLRVQEIRGQLLTEIRKLETSGAGTTTSLGADQTAAAAARGFDLPVEQEDLGLQADDLRTSLDSLTSIYEIFGAFRTRLDDEAAEEFAETLKSVKDSFSLVASQLELGLISPAEARKAAETALDSAAELVVPGETDTELAYIDAQKSWLSNEQSIMDDELAAAETIEDERVRAAAKVRILEAFVIRAGTKTLENSRDVREAQREIAELQKEILEVAGSGMEEWAKSIAGLARTLAEKLYANDLLLAVLEAELAALRNLTLTGEVLNKILLINQEIRGLKRQSAGLAYTEETATLVEQYLASRPVQSSLASVESELIRVQREMANFVGMDSERLALLNEERKLLTDRQQIYLDRIKASVALQAGVRDSTLALKGQLVINARELKLVAEVQGVESAAFLQLKLAQLQLQSQLADSILNLEGIDRRLGTDLTNSFAQAQLDLVDVLRKLQVPDLGDLEQAQLELERRNKEAAQESAFFNDRMFQLKFLFETGEVGTSAYIGSLQKLLEQVDTSTQQGKEIFLTIQGLIDGLTGDVSDLAFNIPSSIRLPTLFEVRRSLAADELSVNYQDNRQMDIDINVSDAVEMSELVSLLSNALGDNITVDSARFAPGATGITLGGF